ncbi:MAG TPA: hypothetical protein DEO57_07870, partial [Phycisphaerales bacterium]|nr:hypothetical protein [Phycisphaerales bacterium]
MNASPRIKSSLLINLSAVIVIWVLISMLGALLFLVWIVRSAAEQQVALEGDVIGSVATAAG